MTVILGATCIFFFSDSLDKSPEVYYTFIENKNRGEGNAMLYGDGIHDDTAEIQKMLNARGIVTLNRPGTYLITKTLIIGSNTRLVLSPGARLLAAPMSRCALIENEHFAGGGRDENIGLEGGIFDGNCDEMGLDALYEAQHRLDDEYSPSLFKGKLIRLAHVTNIALEGLTVRNPVSYGIQIADVVGFAVRDIRFDYNWHFGTTDGVHINGPAHNGVIENLYGTTNDDMVSLTTIDESHAEITKGEIANVDIRNVSASNGYSGVRLLTAEDLPLSNVRISGVYGDYRHNAVLISQHNMRPGTRSFFDGIYIEHIHVRKSCTPLGEGCFRMWESENMRGPLIWLERGVEIGEVIIRDVSRNERSTVTNAPLIGLNAGVRIRRLVMENISQINAEGVTAPYIENNADIEELITRDISPLRRAN